MGKIIIENISHIPDSKAVNYVQRVMEMGRISNFGKQYCYLTTFQDVIIASALNKKSDKFIVASAGDDQS